MKLYRMINNGSTSPLVTRLLVVFMAAGLVAALSTGCERDVTIEGQNDGPSNQNDGNDENQNDDPHNQDDDHLDSHGPDENEELLEVGSLQGSWRVAVVDDNSDTPLAYLDIFHDEGESTADGDFMMGPAMGDMLDGTTGQLDEVSIDGDQVEISWNPTTQSTEMYTISLQPSDSDSYSGSFSAAQNPATHEVSFNRMNTEE